MSLRDQFRRLIYFSDLFFAPASSVFYAFLHVKYFGFSIMSLTFLFGVTIWTLAEYGIHRWLHATLNVQHFKHHRFPTHLNGPGWILKNVVFLAIFWTFELLFGFQVSSAMFSGVLAGYSYYLFLHHGTHHTKLLLNHPLRKHHESHHYGQPNTFGVTTKFWDNFFKE